jgi:hypothetical protein
VICSFPICEPAFISGETRSHRSQENTCRITADSLFVIPDGLHGFGKEPQVWSLRCCTQRHLYTFVFLSMDGAWSYRCTYSSVSVHMTHSRILVARVIEHRAHWRAGSSHIQKDMQRATFDLAAGRTKGTTFWRFYHAYDRSCYFSKCFCDLLHFPQP